jgi:Putative transposase
VIPAGGLSADHCSWIHPRYPFFLPVKALSRVFRGKFVAGLKRLYRRRKLNCSGSAASLAEPKQFDKLLRRVHRQDWVVYAKPAFGGPLQVLRYLGRYTHRVAISNHRIVAFDGEHVTFRYKDYARGSKQRVMTLTGVEFLRRFFLHILPKGFVRIRHFGLFANHWRTARLAVCREVLGCTASTVLADPIQTQVPTAWQCPNCGTRMLVVQRLTAAELSSRRAFFDSS